MTESTAMQVRQSTGLAIPDGHSILGERRVRIPTSGKIRPGIKVLVQRHVNPATTKVYEDGVRQGHDWDKIDAAVKNALGDKAPQYSALTPKNVDYFTVRPGDFTMPECAAEIMRLYGEDRGQGRRLYRFPVVFPVDSWLAVMPHAYKAYTRSQLRFWSEYDRDGVRWCMTRAPLEKLDNPDKRSKRNFQKPGAGRPAIKRDWNEGRCAPGQCPEYQKGECKLSGSLVFYVPGVRVAGAIELPTTSFYSLEAIHEQLELMMHARGRITGTVNGQPMFYVTKRYDEVSMLDLESGEPKRVKQWLVALEGAVDMTNLLPSAADTDMPAQTPVAVLEGRAPSRDDGEIADGHYTEAGGAPPDDGPPPVDADEFGGDAPREPTLEELQASIGNRLRTLQIQFADFDPYAMTAFGEDWKSNTTLLGRALDKLESIEDVEAFHAEMAQQKGFSA